MNLNQIPTWAGWLLVVIAVALTGVTIVAADNGDGGHTVTIARTKTVQDTTAPATPKQVAEAPPAGELQSSPAEVAKLRDSTPAGVPETTLEKAEQRADTIAEDTGVEDADAPIAQGGAQGYTCRKSYQSRGYGAFRSYFLNFFLHYTVSANSPGWGDVYAIKNYLNSVGLSATFIIDFEGHCLQTVPLDRNPYTQGSFNQYGVSVEIVATGKETTAQWLSAPLIKGGILSSLVRDTLKSHNLPVRFVDPVGCTPIAGYTDHNHLECGNDHVDVSPYFPWAEFNKQATGGGCSKACERRKGLRAKHKRTHERFRKNKCAHGNKKHKGRPRSNKYCVTLRNRNKAIHAAAKRERISLKGTY